jgi:RNA-directed DNA polymerase
MSLQAPSRVQKLQNALQAKAKGSSGFRFYALYDKIVREDVLTHSYRLARAKGGKPGVDRERFQDIEAYGVERWLDELAQALKKKRYRPESVRRLYTPKPNGKQRPLGIPTIRDRVVQTAAALVLAPIFEADLCNRNSMPIGRDMVPTVRCAVSMGCSGPVTRRWWTRTCRTTSAA